MRPPTPAELASLSVFLEHEGGRCSGTKVSRNAIVTDHHCTFLGGKLLRMDGTPVEVLGQYDDGNDHSLVVTNRKFTRWATFGRPARTGERVHVMGNPHRLRDVYRVGYVASTAPTQCSDLPTVTAGHRGADGNCPTSLYDFPGGGGDSGAGIFDDKGRLVGVVFGTQPVGINGPGDIYTTLAVSLPLRFTPEQWKAAGVTRPPKQQ